MKKILVPFLAITLALQSCKRDEDTTTTVQEVSDLAEQNSNDDKAIQKYLEEHYLDSQGLIKAFSTTDTSDDNQKKLSEMVTKTLPSGVVVIVREGAQPTDGKTIGETDVLRLMCKNITFLSQKNDKGEVVYTSQSNFVNTIDTSGTPEKDPYYYYVKKSALETATVEAAKNRSYYEIEGFQEGLKEFKAYNNLPDSEGYNLQGVIIVPSRAAYARDAHYLSSYRNRNFVFNFQVYDSSARIEG